MSERHLKVVEVDYDRLERLEERLGRIENQSCHLEKVVIEQCAEIRRLLHNVNEHYSYPPWIDKKSALKILQSKDKRTLDEQVEQGLIEAKPIGRAGTGYRYLYNKNDCIAWAVNKAAQIFEETK